MKADTYLAIVFGLQPEKIFSIPHDGIYRLQPGGAMTKLSSVESLTDAIESAVENGGLTLLHRQAGEVVSATVAECIEASGVGEDQYNFLTVLLKFYIDAWKEAPISLLVEAGANISVYLAE